MRVVGSHMYMDLFYIVYNFTFEGILKQYVNIICWHIVSYYLLTYSVSLVMWNCFCMKLWIHYQKVEWYILSWKREYTSIKFVCIQVRNIFVFVVDFGTIQDLLFYHSSSSCYCRIITCKFFYCLGSAVFHWHTVKIN